MVSTCWPRFRPDKGPEPGAASSAIAWPPPGVFLTTSWSPLISRTGLAAAVVPAAAGRGAAGTDRAEAAPPVVAEAAPEAPAARRTVAAVAATPATSVLR